MSHAISQFFSRQQTAHLQACDGFFYCSVPNFPWILAILTTVLWYVCNTVTGLTLTFSLLHTPYFVLCEKGLSLNLELMILADWPARSLGSPVSASPALGLKAHTIASRVFLSC